MCAYIGIIATILQLMLWHMDSAPTLKYYGHQLESSASRTLRERQCTLEGKVRYVNVQGSVHWRECTLGVQHTLIDILKLTNQK